jgi:mRNA interferase HigB
MRVISRKALVRFWSLHPGAQAPLVLWYRRTLAAHWDDFSDVKRTFGQTDQVKVRSGNTVAVFDVGGNKFRLVARISYNKQKVYVLRILTHKEYDRDAWKEQL